MDLSPQLQALLSVLGGLGILTALGTWATGRWSAGGKTQMIRALSGEFARVAELNGFRASVEADLVGLSTKLTGVHRMAEVATANADTALDKVNEMEIRVTTQWERITERMADTARTLERVTDRVERMALDQAKLEGERTVERRRTPRQEG